jgi:hypothetical protein
MSGRFINVCFIIIVFMLVACESGTEKKLKGKWVLTNTVTGGTPTSYWFQGEGKVVGPWDKRQTAFRSEGKVEFINNTHFKIIMNNGYYKGKTFDFEIEQLDEKELILLDSIQEIKMRRAE